VSGGECNCIESGSNVVPQGVNFFDNKQETDRKSKVDVNEEENSNQSGSHLSRLANQKRNRFCGGL